MRSIPHTNNFLLPSCCRAETQQLLLDSGQNCQNFKTFCKRPLSKYIDTGVVIIATAT